MLESRLRREADFHDRTFTEKSRAATGKFYTAAARGKLLYRELVRKDCVGRQILEYGCGTGSYAFDLARAGARVAGIDISAAGIELAQQRAAAEDLSEQITFQVMNAESLGFPDCRFDLVCGSGILHHLHLERALEELSRVLKADGQAIFFEPLGHNPFINFYRRLTPALRSVDEHPLHLGDLRLFANYFEQTEFHFFSLCSLLAVPFRSLPGFGLLLRALEGVDQLLFRIPFLQKQAWIVVAHLSRPRSVADEDQEDEPPR